MTQGPWICKIEYERIESGEDDGGVEISSVVVNSRECGAVAGEYGGATRSRAKPRKPRNGSGSRAAFRGSDLVSTSRLCPYSPSPSSAHTIMATFPTNRQHLPQGFISSYSPRLRTYRNSLLAP